MAKNDLFGAYDAVHGSMDISDVGDAKLQDTIARLLRSRPLERLRSVKQLGFVSRGYPAADHSRFGHAIGTMQMMRKLIHRIRPNPDRASLELGSAADKESPNSGGLPEELLSALVEKHDLHGDPWKHIVNHLMLAALLQDVGELPYHQATKEFFEPSKRLKNSILEIGTYDLTKWKVKDQFTVGCLQYLKDRHEGIFDNICMRLLVYLITEQSSEEIDESDFRPLRHMLDGAVDADRLDYVYRDGHHTIGYFGTPQSVIDSLLRYENEGPVFCEPAPVSNLLLMRAHLYITVYLSPIDRFQTQLLRTILEDVKNTEKFLPQAERVFGDLLDKLSVDEFLHLHDSTLVSRVEQVATEKEKYDSLSPKALKALSIFLEQQADYESIWLLPSQAGSTKQGEVKLPENLILFYDDLSERDLRIYRPGTIRIESARFGPKPVPLEETSGIFKGIAAGQWSPLPEPGSILLFKPKRPDTEWKVVEEAIHSGTLYHELAIPKRNVARDTRAQDDFLRPDLFISYAFLDQRTMFQIATELTRRKQRYFFLDAHGPGKPAPENIREHVGRADAFLLILSSNYLGRLETERNGNLSVEVHAIAEEFVRREGRVPFGFINLGVEDDKIARVFPWSLFHWERMPPAHPLKLSERDALERCVSRIIEEIRHP